MRVSQTVFACKQLQILCKMISVRFQTGCLDKWEYVYLFPALQYKIKQKQDSRHWLRVIATSVVEICFYFLLNLGNPFYVVEVTFDVFSRGLNPQFHFFFNLIDNNLIV